MPWGQRFTDRQLAQAAVNAGWTADQAVTAVAIALAESGGRMVVNDSPGETPASRRGVESCASYGPWQINFCPGRDAGTPRETAATTPDLQTHANIAAGVSGGGSSWTPWTMYTNGGYRRHLGRAGKAVRDVGANPTDVPVDGGPSGLPGPLGAAADGFRGLLDLAGLDQIADTADAVRAVAVGTVKLLGELLDPDNWHRAGLVLGGVVLAVVGLVLLVGDTVVGDLVGAAAGTAKGPAGAAAGAVASAAGN